ncbi:FAD-dependent oxidoreductase [Streptomyces sp. NBC_00564]|uniref:NAD(P)/FAD-dependent oxidoreductase n=1 Tax=Streptomyces sp. NBC_00564 TaxID=2903663 RepID=UPI002FCD7EEB|nr:FAD-dependent oxidoreductase [Streptomyces sp. NBC_00564]
MRRVAVVGASAAGLAAAETLRRENFGGTITLIGDEPHLPYDRPPLSKQILSGEWGADRLPLRTPADVDALKLELRLGSAATGLDLAGRSVALADGDQVPYDGLVIATGVRPRRLPGHARAHVLRTLEDALALKGRLEAGCRLVVVGAGFLGAEAAAVARGLGVEVTLLEPAPVPLAHAVGEEVGRVLSGAHADHGVDLRTGVLVQEVTAEGVRLADGTLIEADEVLVAIGSLPNTEWLEGSGLRLDNGLVCDEYGQAASGVYGAGDVAHWYNPLFGTSMRIEHRTHASEQGMAVIRNLLCEDSGAQRAFAPVPYFWSDQYDMKIQAYGYLRGHEEIAVVEGSLAERRFVAAYRRGTRLVGVLGVGVPPKAIRSWRAAIAAGAEWRDTVRGVPAA